MVSRKAALLLILALVLLALTGVMVLAEDAPVIQSVSTIFMSGDKVVGAGAGWEIAADPATDKVVILPSKVPVVVTQSGKVHLFMPSEKAICVSVNPADLSSLKKDVLPQDLTYIMDARAASILGTQTGNWNVATQIIGMTPDSATTCDVPSVPDTFTTNVAGYYDANPGSAFSGSLALWQEGTYISLPPFISRVNLHSTERLSGFVGVGAQFDLRDANPSSDTPYAGCFEVVSNVTVVTYDAASSVPAFHAYLQDGHVKPLPQVLSAKSCPGVTQPSFRVVEVSIATPTKTA